jgi:carboxylesterase type B
MGNTLSAYHEEEYVLDLQKGGKIRGIQYDNKARRYAGVPYSLPPTGECRWKKPRPLPQDFSYSGQGGMPFDATAFRPPCPQSAFSAGAEKEVIDGEAFSEDCLILNIWMPVEGQEDQGEKWPVYIWFHGGWFQMGTPSQEEAMNPVELISTGQLDAIVIAVGYRLNVFGFLASKELKQESGGQYAGNFGLWDQRLALEWVKDNIGHFNGDAENITLAGRSAGAYGVHAQLMYELSPVKDTGDQRTLFHRIFMCSNAIPAQPRALIEAQPQFEELCAYFSISQSESGSNKLQALRKISAGELVEAMKHLTAHTFRPITDNMFIAPGMMEYQRSREFATEFLQRDMKLLIGEVLNEETLYAAYNTPRAGLESLKVELANYYGDSTAERILSNYSLPPEGSSEEDWKALFGRIVSDGQVRAPSRALIQGLSNNGVPLERIWRYQIAYRLSFITAKQAPKSFGVAHAMDKPFWK